MKNKNLNIVLSALIVASVLSTTAVFADGFDRHGQNFGPGQKFGQNMDSEVHEQIRATIEAGDYQAWLDLMEEYRPNATQVMTEEEFQLMKQAHELIQDGKFEEAKELMPEGFKKGPREFKEHKGGKNKEEIEQALSNEDYETFKSLAPHDVTQEDFAKMVEAHKLMESGEFEAAKEIWMELKPEDTEFRGPNRRWSRPGMGIKKL